MFLEICNPLDLCAFTRHRILNQHNICATMVFAVSLHSYFLPDVNSFAFFPVQIPLRFTLFLPSPVLLEGTTHDLVHHSSDRHPEISDA